MPFHAKCANRSEPSKRHEQAGVAEEWFTPELLSMFSFSGISFDFFIDWRNETLSPEFWVKRLIHEQNVLPTISREFIQNLIYTCDGENNVKNLARFANGNLRYKLFRETDDWINHPNNPNPILDVKINSYGEVIQVSRIPLESLKEDIRLLSGGPVKIGKKGLNSAYTTLECFLSSTDALWPGDVDLLLIGNDNRPRAIFEFKKHTLKEAIEKHKFSCYYPYPDGRKYNRLALLRDSFRENKLPIIVIYFPTESNFEEILIEEIVGEYKNLSATKEIRHPLPITIEQKVQLMRKIIDTYLT